MYALDLSESWSMLTDLKKSRISSLRVPSWPSSQRLCQRSWNVAGRGGTPSSQVERSGAGLTGGGGGLTVKRGGACREEAKRSSGETERLGWVGRCW